MFLSCIVLIGGLRLIATALWRGSRSVRADGVSVCPWRVRDSDPTSGLSRADFGKWRFQAVNLAALKRLSLRNPGVQRRNSAGVGGRPASTR